MGFAMTVKYCIIGKCNLLDNRPKPAYRCFFQAFNRLTTIHHFVEEEYEKLVKRMQQMNIPEKELWWYLETRKFGTVEHSGFGLGFERLIMFITGMSNIRDVIPFPRTPGSSVC